MGSRQGCVPLNSGVLWLLYDNPELWVVVQVPHSCPARVMSYWSFCGDRARGACVLNHYGIRLPKKRRLSVAEVLHYWGYVTAL